MSDASRDRIGEWRSKLKQTITSGLKTIIAPEPRRRRLSGRNRPDNYAPNDNVPPKQPRGPAPAPPTHQAPSQPTAMTPTRKSNTPTKLKSEFQTEQPSPRNSPITMAGTVLGYAGSMHQLPQNQPESNVPLLADVGGIEDRKDMPTPYGQMTTFPMTTSTIDSELNADFIIPKPRDMPPHDDIYYTSNIVSVPEQLEVHHTRHRSHGHRQPPPHNRSQSADFEVTDPPPNFPIVCVGAPRPRQHQPHPLPPRGPAPGQFSHSIEHRSRSANDGDRLSRVIKGDLIESHPQPALARSHSVVCPENRRIEQYPTGLVRTVAEKNTAPFRQRERIHQQSRPDDPPPGKKRVKYILKGEGFLLYEYYKPTRILGYGAYAVVCEAIDTRTNAVVAIKKNKRIFADIKDAKRMFREIKLLLHFKHDDMVRLIDVIPPDIRDRDTFDDIYLVTNRMQTNLKRVINSKSLDYGATHIKFFIYQILRGLKYIHSAGVVHRDLKPENILVDENCKIRISDFGLARGIAKDDEPQTEYVITRWYRAPEVMLCSGEYDELVDVWSVGCIFAEIFLRTPLFPGANHVQQMQIILMVLGKPVDTTWIKSQEARQWIDGMPPSSSRDFHQLFPKASEPAIDLMQRMLRINPAERVTVEEGLRHPYLDELHHEKSEVTCHEPFVLGDDFERAINSEFGIRHMMYETLRDAERQQEERRARRKKKKSERRKNKSSKPKKAITT